MSWIWNQLNGRTHRNVPCAMNNPLLVSWVKWTQPVQTGSACRLEKPPPCRYHPSPCNVGNCSSTNWWTYSQDTCRFSWALDWSSIISLPYFICLKMVSAHQRRAQYYLCLGHVHQPHCWAWLFFLLADSSCLSQNLRPSSRHQPHLRPEHRDKKKYFATTKKHLPLVAIRRSHILGGATETWWRHVTFVSARSF